MNGIKTKICDQIVKPLSIQVNYCISNKVDTVVIAQVCREVYNQVHVKMINNLSESIKR